MKNERKSGLLMHISSLPGPDGIGTLGKSAKDWIDAMQAAGQTLWQILPLGPTGYGNSPYASWSAFAGNPLFIDLSFFDERIYESDDFRSLPQNTVDYDKLSAIKLPLLKKFADDFIQKEYQNRDYLDFKYIHRSWLNDYALFYALKERFDNKAFFEFPEALRLRESSALHEYGTELAGEIENAKAIQYIFLKQWHEIKQYAEQKGIKIIGDVPLYVAEDSADVWANPEIFSLDEDRKPIKVAGVPPDYFSKTGQLWGNPVYNWQKLEETGFHWWMDRMRMNFNMFDMLRIDHFRGLSEFWAVPYGNKTAEQGEWLPGPGDSFFYTLMNQIPNAEVIAEDLGLLTDDVIRLRDKFQFPGMKILQFAFDTGPQNQFLPHNYVNNCIVYTGTHDNDTNIGWYKQADKKEQVYCKKYTGARPDKLNQAFIRTAFASVAHTVIIQMQDVLELDSRHRMNTPGKLGRNWEWRMLPDAFDDKRKSWLKDLTATFGRSPETKQQKSKY
jgi:4-alpha-glucanotransferase